MTRNPYIGFDDRLMRIIGVPFIAFIIPLIFFGQSLRNGIQAYWPEWGKSIVYTFIVWEVMRATFIALRKRFHRIEQTKQRIIWQAVVSIGITLSICEIARLCMFILLNVGQIRLQVHLPNRLQANSGALMVTAMVCAIYESIYYFRKLQNALIEAEQLKKENIESQLETLKNQVNPHFLFNSLNTLATLIPEDADLAVEFVQKMSKVYRYILEIRDLQTVSLREELMALKAYIFLLQIRFGNNLKIKLDVPEEYLNDKIVPLSLQMLMENAVKHNIISTQKMLSVEVFVEKGRLIMRNNLQKKNQPSDSTGLGLQNIQNRYQLLNNQQVDIIVTTQTFTVSLPLIPVKTYASLAH